MDERGPTFHHPPTGCPWEKEYNTGVLVCDLCINDHILTWHFQANDEFPRPGERSQTSEETDFHNDPTTSTRLGSILKVWSHAFPFGDTWYSVFLHYLITYLCKLKWKGFFKFKIGVCRDEYSTPSNLHGLGVDSKSVPNLRASPSSSSPVPALPVKMRRSMNSKIGISVKDPEINIQPEQKWDLFCRRQKQLQFKGYCWTDCSGCEKQNQGIIVLVFKYHQFNQSSIQM